MDWKRPEDVADTLWPVIVGGKYADVVDAIRKHGEACADIGALARAYGETWHAFDRAGEEAEKEYGARKGDYPDDVRDRLSALAHERAAAHIKLLRALGIDTK